MDFLDEYDESRPRISFQHRPIQSPNPTINSQKNKPLIFLSLTFSLFFLASSFFFFQSQFLQPLFLWLFLSLLVGPFAPLSLTAGDIRVGSGRVVEFPPQPESDDEDPKKKVNFKRNRGKRSDLDGVNSNGVSDFPKNGVSDLVKNEGLGVDLKENEKGVLDSESEIEGDWTEEDLVLLRKQIVKNPVGKPKRWAVISEAFKGKHTVDSVINKAKSLGKEKPVDSDSYSKFLKDRKAVDKRVDEGNDDFVANENGGEDVTSWSSAEDIALLNALKTFPKEVAMRWEKISASIPGKSKALCMKRVSVLKKEFRSSKGSNES